jgi:excisionase family DNA binding protein
MLTIDGIDYLEVGEAAALLGVKKATIYAYVSRGVLESFRQGVGRKRLYRRAEVEALREARPSDAPVSNEAAEVAAPREARPSEAPTLNEAEDDVVRNVRLPEVASWAGEH